MKRKIPKEYFEEIKEKIDWGDIFRSLGIKAKRVFKGDFRFETLCVFHKETTPSLLFDPNKNTFRCFGCGENGDLFNFVHFYLKSKNKTRTMRFFQKNFGIPLPFPKK